MSQGLTAEEQRQLMAAVMALSGRLEELERYILTQREATLIMTRAGEDYLKLKRSRPTKAEGRGRV